MRKKLLPSDWYVLARFLWRERGRIRRQRVIDSSYRRVRPGPQEPVNAGDYIGNLI